MPFPRKYHCDFIIDVNQEIVFNVIIDVVRYQEFVPFCLRSRILPGSEYRIDNIESNDPRVFYAELAVGFHQFNESYVSKVTFYGKDRVEAEAVDSSLFNHLKTTWTVTKLDEGRCRVDFSVDFEFKSYIYAYAANIFFINVSKEMLVAFQKRAKRMAEETEQNSKLK